MRTHDHIFDAPAPVAARRTTAGRLGATGSRRTHAERGARLPAGFLDDARPGRTHGPIGLDLGARPPEEAAIAIRADVIAGRTGQAAPSRRDTEGPRR